MIRRKDTKHDGPKRKKVKTEMSGNAKIKDLLEAIKIKKERKEQRDSLVTENGVEKLFDYEILKTNGNDGIVIEVLVMIILMNYYKNHT